MDPLGVLSLLDPDMDLDQVNELCDRFEEQAPMMGANEALSYVGPEEDRALRAWLEPSVSENLEVPAQQAKARRNHVDIWLINVDGVEPFYVEKS